MEPIGYLPTLAALRGAALPRRSLARTLIAGSQGELELSVPVAGGSRALLRAADPMGLPISLHGNWPHMHLGALEAAYGRAPYYQYFISAIREILLSPPATLGGLNMAMLGAVRGMLGVTQGALRLASAERFAALAAERNADADPRLSIIHYALTLGPEAIFLLPPTLF